ncbi:hypothetical protein [uncultured Tateyamaria sp.]|uniref:hypothetical protein n=1 Tax=uncultured Tateyamaria sp. TaxID=455651 RepID=UPI002629D78F|nr:hypothetical protein [uncultured Tateyamaria sp.]
MRLRQLQSLQAEPCDKRWIPHTDIFEENTGLIRFNFHPIHIQPNTLAIGLQYLWILSPGAAQFRKTLPQAGRFLVGATGAP